MKSLVQWLRISRQQDIEEAREYIMEPDHLGVLEARRLAFDPTTETRAQHEHLHTCGRCSRMVMHVQQAIDHPSAISLAGFAENAPAADQADVRLHIDVDRCRSCTMRLASSPKVAAHRALIRTGRSIERAMRRPVLSAFVPVPAGLRSSDSSSAVDVTAADREHSVTARLWQLERGGLELVVRMDDSALAQARLPVELTGQHGCWVGEVVLDERDAYDSCVGRLLIGPAREVLHMAGSADAGLTLTVTLPGGPRSAAPPANSSPGAIEHADERGAERSPPPDLAALTAQLEDSHEDPKARAAAAMIIRSLGPAALTPPVVAALAGLLDNADSAVRDSAVRALEALAD